MNRKEEIKKLAAEAKTLKAKYTKLYEEDQTTEAIETEKKYLKVRGELLNLINSDIKEARSITLSNLEKRVKERPKTIPISTGIDSLDKYLVKENEFGHKLGGFPMGNFIQIVGKKGAGKTTIMMKLLAGLSHGTNVEWFNFEMSDEQVIEKFLPFGPNKENVFYYEGDRSLNEILDEIKVMNAQGVNHFVIDSNMKIRVKGVDALTANAMISDELKALTSILRVNIYLINQISQQSERENGLFIKGGNDSEYDSDMILFIIRPQKKIDGKPAVDEAGLPIYDDLVRYIKCTKNRLYDWEFLAKIPKDDIFPPQPPVIIEANSIDMPIV